MFTTAQMYQLTCTCLLSNTFSNTFSGTLLLTISPYFTQELQTRYDTLLQMYGEKAEEVHELQLDLADVREAYKAQIEQLLAKVIR